MEEGKKKMVMVAVAVICLLLAGVITAVRLMKPKAGTVDSIPDSEMIWVKCINPKCNATYEMSLKKYMLAMQSDNTPLMDGATKFIKCEKCGKNSIVKAIKCEKCGYVFAEGEVPRDYYDRCPKCGYSKIEEAKKQLQ
jgi:predicted Zn-ribbon and HTH transcriptional regulator